MEGENDHFFAVTVNDFVLGSAALLVVDAVDVAVAPVLDVDMDVDVDAGVGVLLVGVVLLCEDLVLLPLPEVVEDVFALDFLSNSSAGSDAVSIAASVDTSSVATGFSFSWKGFQEQEVRVRDNKIPMMNDLYI